MKNLKIIKINSLTTILFIFFLFGVAFLLPIVIIESIWNTTVAKSFNISIDFWQALILWLITLVSLNILGIFKFEFALESTDEETLNKKLDALKNKIEEIKNTENK